MTPLCLGAEIRNQVSQLHPVDPIGIKSLVCPGLCKWLKVLWLWWPLVRSEWPLALLVREQACQFWIVFLSDGDWELCLTDSVTVLAGVSPRCRRGARRCFVPEAVYNLPWRSQALRSEELKQEVSSWCSPSTAFIEANQLPNILACRPLRKVSVLQAEVAHGLLWSVRCGDGLFNCSWDAQDLLAGQGWCQEWISNQRAESCLNRKVGREEWKSLVKTGEGPRVFWPGELT